MEETSEYKESFWDIMSKNWYLIIFFIIYFFFNKKWGDVTYDKARYYSIMGLLLISLGKLFWEWGKYKSPQLIWYKGSASLNYKDIYKIGDWRISKLGGIDYSGLSFPGFEGTIIAPSGYWHKIGDGWVIRARCMLISLEVLPNQIKQFIVDHNYPTKRIWLGYYPVEMEIKNVDLLGLELKNQELERTNNKLRSYLSGNFKDIEKTLGIMRRMGKKSTIIDKLKDRLKGEDNDSPS